MNVWPMMTGAVSNSKIEFRHGGRKAVSTVQSTTRRFRHCTLVCRRDQEIYPITPRPHLMTFGVFDCGHFDSITRSTSSAASRHETVLYRNLPPAVKKISSGTSKLRAKEETFHLAATTPAGSGWSVGP